MNKLTFIVGFSFYLFLSCTHSQTGQRVESAIKGKPETSGAQSTPIKETNLREKPLSCVKMINQFGQTANCQCPSGLVYNPITGKCVQGGRICTQALVDMYNEKTGQCYTARNGCEASDLKSIGWRIRLEKDTCKSTLERQRIR
jgi:hypothetical protein